MIISVSETFTHTSPCREKANFKKEEELKKAILKLIKRSGINPNKAKWTEEGRLELNDANQLKLHSLMLQAEELGLDLKMTKKTQIEIC